MSGDTAELVEREREREYGRERKREKEGELRHLFLQFSRNFNAHHFIVPSMTKTNI